MSAVLTSAAAWVLLFAFLISGCAGALKSPPPLPELGGGGPAASAEEVQALLARAEALYASRTLASVRQAADLWLVAARANPPRIEALEGSARAQIWLAGHESEPVLRENAATLAVQSAQWCLRVAPDGAQCHYWLGAALGVQAREKHSTALDALPRIEQAFLTAAEKDPGLDEAGPDRALALLYLRAPGWPAGPGDPDRGMERARKAAALKPDYPPNHLALGEAFSSVGERESAVREYSRALEMARKRRAEGDPDAPEWIREAEAALAALHRDF